MCCLSLFVKALESRAGDTNGPFRPAIAKAFAFRDYLFLSIAKSKALAVFTNTHRPMGIGPYALFAIAMLCIVLFKLIVNLEFLKVCFLQLQSCSSKFQ